MAGGRVHGVSSSQGAHKAAKRRASFRIAVGFRRGSKSGRAKRLALVTLPRRSTTDRPLGRDCQDKVARSLWAWAHDQFLAGSLSNLGLAHHGNKSLGAATLRSGFA